MEDLPERINLAKQLLQNVRFAAMATVNEDGTPHNTPYFFMYDETLTHLYWGSRGDALHTKNIMRTGEVFVTLYDSQKYGGGGLYIKASNARFLEGDEFTEGLRVHNHMRSRLGKHPIPISYYEDKANGQNMYGADIQQLQVYTVERGADGYIVRETRATISPKDLIN